VAVGDKRAASETPIRADIAKKDHSKADFGQHRGKRKQLQVDLRKNGADAPSMIREADVCPPDPRRSAWGQLLRSNAGKLAQMKPSAPVIPQSM
jgi:hypothetical protein